MKAENCLTGFVQPKGRSDQQVRSWLQEKTVRMGELARAIVFIDENCKVKMTDIRPDFAYTGNYLVVIGPAKVNGELVNDAVRLEIGFGRSVPYQTFEWSEFGKTKTMKTRWYVPLTDEEVLLLLPTLCNMIQKMVDETLIPRKSVTFRKKEGERTRTFTSGCFITVPAEPAILQYAFLARNRAVRNGKYLSSLAQQVWYEFRGLRYSTYSAKEMKAHAGVRKIAAKLSAYTQKQIDFVREKIGSPARSKNRALFERTIEIFQIKFRTRKEEYERTYDRLAKKYGDREKEILKRIPLDAATHPRRDRGRKIHARDCLRIEVHPSKWLIENHENLKEEAAIKAAENEYHGEF